MAAAGACAALGPGPAGAGESSDDTVVTSRTLPGGGYVLEVTAAPGQENSVSCYGDGDGSDAGPLGSIRDAVGIKDDSPRCMQESEIEVACNLQGLRRLIVDTGDMGDRLAIRVFSGEACDWTYVSSVKLGAGSDSARACGLASVEGQPGDDTLNGGTRNQRLFGGRGADVITGGRGNNDHCDGEVGNDSGGDGCETIVSL